MPLLYMLEGMQTKKLRNRITVWFVWALGICSCGKSHQESPGQSVLINSYEAVDLGLSVKWASHNVGAVNPEDFGSYYGWGEVSGKVEFSWKTYQHYNPSSDLYFHIGDNISGTKYDVAHVEWGGSWRIPTDAEFRELLDKCTWCWTEMNGVKGKKVIGPNGNYIFLPAAMYRYGINAQDTVPAGYYWTGSAREDDGYDACYLFFYPEKEHLVYCDRSLGQSIRPVFISPK